MLAACGNQRDDRMHTERAPNTQNVFTEDIAELSVQLTASGVGGFVYDDTEDDLAFGAPRDRIETYLTSILGEPIARHSNNECGAGPMQMSDYAGLLTVNFQDDKLVGWLLQDDGTSNPVRVTEALGVENTISDLRVGLDGFSLVDDSTLGNEFTSAQGIGGFLDEKSIGVDAFYAGTNCFFR